MNELNEYVRPNVTTGVTFVAVGVMVDIGTPRQRLEWRAGFQATGANGSQVWTADPGVGDTLAAAVAAFTGIVLGCVP